MSSKAQTQYTAISISLSPHADRTGHTRGQHHSRQAGSASPSQTSWRFRRRRVETASLAPHASLVSDWGKCWRLGGSYGKEGDVKCHSWVRWAHWGRQGTRGYARYHRLQIVHFLNSLHKMLETWLRWFHPHTHLRKEEYGWAGHTVNRNKLCNSSFALLALR